ncbi:MAG: nucleotidyltransferase domain-containing protein [Lacisediminihabitans sp.]
MFSIPDRESIRAQLIALATADDRITGAALAGSGAEGTEDEWSDIDLVLQLAPGASESTVVEDWTSAIDRIGDTADTLDLIAGGIQYRVFLLSSSLQIDVSFWPHDQFRATGPSFRLLFGSPNKPADPASIDLDKTIGMGWLYALHARSASARGKLWQASMMLDDLRSALITLKCVRAGVNPWHGREVDMLSGRELAELESTRARHLTSESIDTARSALTKCFLNEVLRHDPNRGEQLRRPFSELARTLEGITPNPSK